MPYTDNNHLPSFALNTVNSSQPGRNLYSHVSLTKSHGHLASHEPCLHMSGGGTQACQTGSGPMVNAENRSLTLTVSTMSMNEEVKT